MIVKITTRGFSTTASTTSPQTLRTFVVLGCTFITDSCTSYGNLHPSQSPISCLLYCVSICTLSTSLTTVCNISPVIKPSLPFDLNNIFEVSARSFSLRCGLLVVPTEKRPPWRSKPYGIHLPIPENNWVCWGCVCVFVSVHMCLCVAGWLDNRPSHYDCQKLESLESSHNK